MVEEAAGAGRVLVIGTGALATLVAGRLARSGGISVTLAGSWADALGAISRRGVVVEEDGVAWSVPARAVRVDGPLEPAGLVVVLVKAWQTAGVAPHVARAVAPGGLVLTLQNGLGNRECLATAAAPAAVAVGVTSMGATLQAPGRVRASGAGETVLGDVPAARATVMRAGRWFERAGMPTAVRADIDTFVWRKLAVNCAINPVSALLGRPNGALLECAQTRATMSEAAREVGAVAAAKGVDLGLDPADLAFRVAGDTATNNSSMLQDVRRGARTEIEQMNGAVVREADRLGIAVPVNRRLWLEVQALGLGAEAAPSARGRA